MWLYLVVLLGLWKLLRLFRERQVVSHLQDKHVFITGCDSGFGNLLARQLDRRGMRVLAACLTENGAEELRSKTSDRLETVILDVTKTESIVAATQWVKERVGNREDFAKVLDVNLLGMIEVTLSMLPLVRKARGRVVNVSSILGRVSFSGSVAYTISKYGVEAFSDSLRRELSYFGVKVAIIEPGFFKTAVSSSEKLSSNIKMMWDQASSEVKEIYGESFLASYLSMLKSLDQKCNEDLSLVTDCMEHALTSCHPRTRYSAGWDAKLFYLPMSYLPTFLVDAMIYWTSIKPTKAL
ncbi:retinol dehydrogenase 16-like isoform X2 [Peromyscus maniculatus bairdii]|uniref:retinol dehydrogenase 16-like isoform X2 n=1 Tax=Peromyscus maniculatus bairdii TaxID=230844 RepID=UPI003FD1A851